MKFIKIENDIINMEQIESIKVRQNKLTVYVNCRRDCVYKYDTPETAKEAFEYIEKRLGLT